MLMISFSVPCKIQSYSTTGETETARIARAIYEFVKQCPGMNSAKIRDVLHHMVDSNVNFKKDRISNVMSILMKADNTPMSFSNRGYGNSYDGVVTVADLPESLYLGDIDSEIQKILDDLSKLGVKYKTEELS